ncbi:MAG: FHA domain-containing protein [Pirellulaceae bacterium]
MQTQMLVEQDDAELYVEVLGDGSGSNRKVPLVDFPFIIGRNDTCSLPVESGRVSREHAEIVKHGSGFLIRDLGSTNGTFVNGEKIKEQPLLDGDTIKIADFDFDFHRPDPHEMRQTVTLAMDEVSSSGKGGARIDTAALVGALRQLSQLAMVDSLRLPTVPILDAHSGSAIATWISPVGECLGELTKAQREVLAKHPRLSNTLRRIQHASVVRGSLTGAMTTKSILFHLTGRDCEDPELIDSFGWMRAKFGPSVELVVGIRLEDAEHDSARRARLYDLLSVGVQFAVIGIDQFRPLPVSGLLDRARFVGISSKSLGAASRSPAVAQNLEEFLVELAQTDRLSIACGVANEQEVELCQSLGFQAIIKDL